MVILLLNAPSRVVNDVSVTSNSPFFTIVIRTVVPGAPCPAGRE
ncbi:hypothetical protein [Devosia riboflavina]|nr:hypothetical protein [Devosia riboflavina]